MQKTKALLNKHKRGWMSLKTGQMKKNSTLNWRSTSTKILIKSYKCFTLKYLPKIWIRIRTEEFEVHVGSPWLAFEKAWLHVLYYTGQCVLSQSKLALEGKVKHPRQQACDFQLAVFFATSTSGRFVKLKINKIYTTVPLVGYEIGYSQLGSTGFVGLVGYLPSHIQRRS